MAIKNNLPKRVLLMAVPTTREYLQLKVLPKSGEGPSREVRETGSYEIVMIGRTSDGETVRARITGQGDPGVRSTTLMLTEAALCLAQDDDQIEIGGGFWTPAAAMGPLLRGRITKHAGITFELV